jgi:hypothetical protein
MTRSLLAIVCLALCGCTTPRTYTQPGAVHGGMSSEITVPAADTNAILHKFENRVFIMSIDDKSTATLWGFLTDNEPYAEIACVRPGRHHLNLKYKSADPTFGFFAFGRVWFDAEAGKNYFVRDRIKGYTVEFWMEESETGKVVGGLPGGETPLDEQTNQPSAIH